MAIIDWRLPTRQRQAKPSPERISNRLPRLVLDHLVSELPGPPNETEAERAVRNDAQRAEVLGFRPRDTVEAMLATHCMMLGMVAEDASRNAARQPATSAEGKKSGRVAKQLSQQTTITHRLLAERQSRPLAPLHLKVLEVLGMNRPQPPAQDDPAEVGQAESAVIVPLHPAPKMLQ
jgi:hypothetical protein